MAMLLEKGNNPVRGSENRPCAKNPSGYRMTLITIRERNLTSTLKNYSFLRFLAPIIRSKQLSKLWVYPMGLLYKIAAKH